MSQTPVWQMVRPHPTVTQGGLVIACVCLIVSPPLVLKLYNDAEEIGPRTEAKHTLFPDVQPKSGPGD